MTDKLRDKIRAIEAMRAAIGLSQAQVGELLGKDQVWVSKMLDFDKRNEHLDEIISALETKYRAEIGDDKLLRHCLKMAGK